MIKDQFDRQEKSGARDLRIHAPSESSDSSNQQEPMELVGSPNSISEEWNPSQPALDVSPVHASDGMDSDIARRIEFVEYLCQEIESEKYELWFDKQVDFQMDARGVVVVAGDQFLLDRLRRNFDLGLRNAAKRLTGEKSIRYEVGEISQSDQPVASETSGSAKLGPAVQEDARQTHPQAGDDSTVDSEIGAKSEASEKLVAEFVFCENNSLAHSAVQEIKQSPGQISPVLFYGPTGCGKSLLLDNIRAGFKGRPGFRFVRLSAEQFTSSYVSALNGRRGLPMFRSHYRDLDLLMLDDIQFFRGKRATTTEFQHTVDCLLASGRQIVLTADRPLNEMDFLSQELVTRMSSGLVCPIRFPNFQARQRIVADLARQREMELSQETIDLLSVKFPRDIRRVCGALNRLRLLGLSSDLRNWSVEQVEENLGDLIQSSPQNWSMRQIENVVCDIAGVSRSEIRSSSREKRICTARMLAMWLSRQHTSSALSEIGAHFGGRSHSTVISATRKVEKLIESDESIQIAKKDCRVREFVERVGRNISEAG